jgi:heme O synthase-like polyprenyltransferase
MLPLASTASFVARVIVGAGLIAALLALAVICAMKGKWVFFVLGWFSGIFWMVGAWRLAKPNSYWVKRRYGDAELTEAQLRFPRRMFSWSEDKKANDDS